MLVRPCLGSKGSASRRSNERGNRQSGLHDGWSFLIYLKRSGADRTVRQFKLARAATLISSTGRRGRDLGPEKGSDPARPAPLPPGRWERRPTPVARYQETQDRDAYCDPADLTDREVGADCGWPSAHHMQCITGAICDAFCLSLGPAGDPLRFRRCRNGASLPRTPCLRRSAPRSDRSRAACDPAGEHRSSRLD